ncbi:hypothetical protein [Loktanella sp. S4079]|uniref:hypothetical protein n=1 Tax=Loktanella sp. S4079 TaxID=579483 RepID=UPI0005FA0A9C|nr:hypothetical protein [Loktanella sp. S4079]KJZ20427.1 hypothetical protein TW80_06410 [Loktanella sp. S4079]
MPNNEKETPDFDDENEGFDDPELERLFRELESISKNKDDDAQEMTQDEAAEAIIGGLLRGIEKLNEADNEFSIEFELKDPVFDAKIGAAVWAGDMARLEELAAEVEDDEPDTRSEDEIKWETYKEALVIMGIDPDIMGSFDDILPDRYADIRAGKSGAIDAFIATGQDPNIKTGVEQVPALFAALDAPERSAKDIRKLIEAGADVTFKYLQCDNAFTCFANYKHSDTVTTESEIELAKLLLAEGADIQFKSPKLGSALMAAILRAGPAQVAALLSVGADVKETLHVDYEREFLSEANVLCIAAPKPAVIQILLDAGADPNMRDSYDLSPPEFIDEEIQVLETVAKDDPWIQDFLVQLRKGRDLLIAAAG